MLALPKNLTVNRRAEPLAIDTAPRFGWTLPGKTRQSAYEVVVVTASLCNGDTVIWRSGKVTDERPFDAAYEGPPLTSRTVYWWRVRVWLVDGTETSWSKSATFETAIVDPADWTACWITDPASARDATPRTLYFRREFHLPAAVARGRAYVSALGWYRAFANCSDLTGHALVPRWTSPSHFVEYQTYDVTEHFTVGINVLGIVVAEGRYRGRIGVSSTPAVYGQRLAAFVQLELDLVDGTAITINTDDEWAVGSGRILSSDPKFGERVDLRINAEDWLHPGGSAENASAALMFTAPFPHLIAEEVERVEVIGRRPGTVSRTDSGAQVVDFGQNFAGVATVRLSGTVGQKVTLAYGEILTEQGELDTSYLETLESDGVATWFQRDEAILAASAVDYTPWFTIHGFRYLQIDGLADTLADDDVEAIVISTALAMTGRFESSCQDLERLHGNALWSMRSNFTDTPTDCPTRERSGWTGDIQVFAPTACILADANNYLRRYLRNLAADQYPDGRVPPVIPREPMRLIAGLDFAGIAATSVGWGDAAVMLPWTLYWYTGDSEVLRLQYQSATAWLDHLQRRALNTRSLRRRWRGIGDDERFIVDTGFHWGEWLRPGEGPGSSLIKNVVNGSASIATAYFAHSAGLLAKMSSTIGEYESAARYQELTENVARAWRTAFVHADGARIGSDRQDDYVRALAFELLLPEQRGPAIHRLATLIEHADDHLGTGFLSTPLLLSTLADNGRSDLAYRILLQTTPPSWMAQIRRGATTIWETWEGYDDAGRAKSSHNHYAFGAVASWLHEYVAGIRPVEPGYRTIAIAPHIGGGLTDAASTLSTPYGPVSSSWSVTDETVRLRVLIPSGTTANIRVDGEVHTVPAGEHAFAFAIPTPRGRL